ncbi:MAG: hypothetical protein ACK57A_19000, partial [Gemmatimonas sp.]
MFRAPRATALVIVATVATVAPVTALHAQSVCTATPVVVRVIANGAPLAGALVQLDAAPGRARTTTTD